MTKQYEEIETLYMAETVNTFLSRGWELVGAPTNGTDPETGLPAPCFTVGKPKAVDDGENFFDGEWVGSDKS